MTGVRASDWISPGILFPSGSPGGPVTEEKRPRADRSERRSHEPQVTLHMELWLESGKLLSSTRAGDPMQYHLGVLMQRTMQTREFAPRSRGRSQWYILTFGPMYFTCSIQTSLIGLKWHVAAPHVFAS